MCESLCSPEDSRLLRGRNAHRNVAIDLSSTNTNDSASQTGALLSSNARRPRFACPLMIATFRTTQPPKGLRCIEHNWTSDQGGRNKRGRQGRKGGEGKEEGTESRGEGGLPRPYARKNHVSLFTYACFRNFKTDCVRRTLPRRKYISVPREVVVVKRGLRKRCEKVSQVYILMARIGEKTNIPHKPKLHIGSTAVHLRV